MSTADFNFELSGQMKPRQESSVPEKNASEEYNIKHLFQTKYLRRVSLVMIFTW